MMDMFGKLGEMKEKMEAAKKKLDDIILIGEANNGTVKAEVTASKNLVSISIADALIAEGDREQIEDLVVVAVKRAMEKADVKAAQEMKSVGNDLLPGLPGMF